MRIKPALLACFLLLAAAPLVAQQSGPVPPPHQPTALQRTPKQPIQSAVERRCQQFSAPELSHQVLEASEQEISALEELAEQCVERGSRRTRSAALHAYGALLTIDASRFYDPLLSEARENAAQAKQSLDTAVRMLNDAQKDLDTERKITAAVAKDEKETIDDYNRLVARYNDLLKDYKQLAAAGNALADTVRDFLVSEYARSAYTSFRQTLAVPVFTQSPAKPLNCTATTYDWGITPVSTYINCHCERLDAHAKPQWQKKSPHDRSHSHPPLKYPEDRRKTPARARFQAPELGVRRGYL
jgi:hypothetical protein